MPIKSSFPLPEAIPEEVDKIQVNCCKKPGCRNFGVPAVNLRPWAAKDVSLEDPDMYGMMRDGRYKALVKCGACDERIPLKSNLAISQEYNRFTKYLYPEDPAKHKSTCEKPDAKFFKDPSEFRYNGTTETGGSPRYECKTCRKSFVVSSKAIVRQRKSHINKWVFKLLVNRVPFQRICELLEIDMTTLYGKINFLHRQCMAFAGDRERKLFEGTDLVDGRKKPEKIYVCIDRQEYSVNWKTRTKKGEDKEDIDRRNVVLDSVGSADLKTGYVFGMHLNFDPGMDTDDVNNEKVKKNGDLDEPLAYREYARVWIENDYQRRKESRRKAKNEHLSTDAALDEAYEDLQEREEEEGGDVESPELMTESKKLPDYGMQVHEEYTIYAHLVFLQRALRGIEKIRFFMDRETAIRAACHSIFAKEIDAGRFEGFFIKTNKTMTNKQKKQAYADAVTEFEKFRTSHPGKKPWEVRLLMLRDRMEKMVAKGRYGDRYLLHPFPDMSEPEKEICHLTDALGRYNGSEEAKNHLAWLYGKVSLHAINRFFMQMRRRVSLMERPIISAASSQRTWFGYGAYNPAMIQKLTDIFRVFYNYVKPTEVRKRKKKFNPFYDDPSAPPPDGETDPEADETTEEKKEEPTAKGKKKRGKTPAMRFGLARAPVRYEDIIYYQR